MKTEMVTAKQADRITKLFQA